MRFGRFSRLASAIAALAAVTVAAVLAAHSPPLAWRLHLISRKATGGVGELSWGEVRAIVMPGTGFDLGESFAEGRSLDSALHDPYQSPRDVQQGARIFRTRCAVCHGSDAKGGRGPSLVGNYQHGNSDLAVYLILRDGIADTAMVPTNLSALQRWQAVGYLRSLQASNAAPAQAPDRVRLEVSEAELQGAGSDTQQWLTYSGNYSSWRYSPASQIDPANVGGLQLRWAHQLLTSETGNEATPLVAHGVIFETVSPNDVVALNAKTGERLWRYQRKVPEKVSLCCGRVNRGLAILGDALFFGTLDAHLVAIDSRNGAVLWDVPVADYRQGYSITGAPLALNGLVVTGVSGGEFGARGLIAAFDAKTGQPRWRFNTVPGPGDSGHQTWESDAWRTGGGPTWMTGSYDPQLSLLYWGVGNPSPVYAGDLRPGDNLYTDSVVALRPDTGQLVWHFQFTPHDEHDWDSTQTPVLADITENGASRRAMLWANRNGFYYVLDRADGKFIAARPFVHQTWAERMDANGRPVLTAAGRVSEHGSLIFPGVGGGTNWQAPAYDPTRRLFFVHATESSSVYTKSKSADLEHTSGQLYVGSGTATSAVETAFVRALDAATGNKVWEFASPPPDGAGVGGLLATGGGLVFGSSGGVMFALDSGTGRELWHVPLGGRSGAAPISVDIDGRQTILAVAGRTLFAFAAPEPARSPQPPAISQESPKRTVRPASVSATAHATRTRAERQ